MLKRGKIALLLLVASTPVRGQTPYRDSIPGTLVGFDMIPVPASPGDRPIWIGKTEVTWDEFDVWALRLDLTQAQQVAGVDATARPSRPYGAPDRGFGHHEYPAIGMTYEAARTYCAWLSAKTGKHYRLPTDAEWTRAVHAGGADADTARAWHAGNSGGMSHAVGTRPPDALGLHDMVGNVAEWVTGPDGPLVRGGSWADPPDRAGAAARVRQTASWNETDPQFPKSRWWLADAPFVGFRIVREP